MDFLKFNTKPVFKLMEIVTTITLKAAEVQTTGYTLRKHYIQTIDMLMQLGANTYVGTMFQIGAINSRN